MSIFMFFGKYSSESLKNISSERTDRAVNLIKKNGGKVISMYAVLGEHDLMAVKTYCDNSFAQPARAEGGQQNIAVQHHLHEMALNTSSSVKNPWASAKGSALSLRLWNFSLAIYRRNESRTISLAGRFCRRDMSCSSFRKASEMRMLMLLIAQYIVLHRTVRSSALPKKPLHGPSGPQPRPSPLRYATQGIFGLLRPGGSAPHASKARPDQSPPPARRLRAISTFLRACCVVG